MSETKWSKQRDRIRALEAQVKEAAAFAAETKAQRDRAMARVKELEDSCRALVQNETNARLMWETAVARAEASEKRTDAVLDELTAANHRADDLKAKLAETHEWFHIELKPRNKPDPWCWFCAHGEARRAQEAKP